MSDWNDPTLDQAPDMFDAKQILAIVRRRIWTIIAASGLTFAAFLIYASQQTPTYTATSSLVLNVGEQQVVDIESVVSGMSSDAAAVGTEVEVLRSRLLAEAVVRDLNLERVPELNSRLREPSGFARFRSSIASIFSGFVPEQVEAANAAPAPVSLEQERERVASAVMRRRSVERVAGTYVINIAFTAQSRELARDVANAYADAYLDSLLEAEFEATERANDWLNERVAQLREEVRARERAVVDFREQENLINISAGGTIAEQQVSDINSQLAVERAALSQARARLDSVQSQLDRGVSPDTIGEIINSTVVQSLRSQESEIRNRLAELTSRYGPRHPQVITAQRELTDVESQISAGIARILANLQNDVDAARERVRSLEQSLRMARAELAEDNAALVRLRELEREADAARALFEAFLNRFQQASSTEGLNEANARIIARATLPGRDGASLSLVIGLLLAAMVGAGAAVLMELFDVGLQDEAAVERALGIPHIASVQRLKPGVLKRLRGETINPASYVVDHPLSGFAESFRAIRSAIRLSAFDAAPKVVAITSALPGEGKTVTSASFGRIAALANANVVVVDCDLRRRLLSAELAPDAQIGLLQVLSGEATLDEALVEDPQTGLKILPLNAVTFTPRDVFASEAFAALLDTLRDKFDQVVLDTPPILAVADTREIAARADAVIMVAKWRKTAVPTVKKAVSELKSVKARILGLVLSSVDLEAQARYGYGSYYRAYQKYYNQ